MATPAYTLNYVLDISRVEAARVELEPVDFDVQTVIRQIADMFRLRYEQKGLEWCVETIEDSMIPVHGDESKIRQILVNLCGNAVKFTDGGSITLRVQRHAEDRYAIEVEDSGRGVEEDRLNIIFEPFHQSHHGAQAEGAGLGFSITKRHVELMPGAIEVTSKPDVGTSFSTNSITCSPRNIGYRAVCRIRQGVAVVSSFSFVFTSFNKSPPQTLLHVAGLSLHQRGCLSH